MTIGRKLAVIFGALFALLCASTGYGLRCIQGMGELLDRQFSRDTASASLLGSVKADVLAMKAQSKDAQFAWLVNNLLTVRTTEKGTKDLPGDCSSCHQFGSSGEQRQGFDALADKAESDVRALEAAIGDVATQQQFRTLHAAVGEWRQLFGRYLELVSAGNFGEAHNLVMGDMEDACGRVTNALGALEKEQKAMLVTSNARSAHTVANAWTTLLVLTGLGLLCSGVVMLGIRRVTGALRGAASDLSQKSNSLVEGAATVRSAGHSLAQGASEQAAAIEETSASAEQVNASARQNADGSERVAGSIDAIRRNVEATNAALNEMAAAMHQIDESGEKVSKVIGLIREIAFQTNLLALNAAVEAARAGEAGMGFAVVADEVRSLAQRCADAARDTEALIDQSVSSARQGRTRLEKLTGGMQSITSETETMSALTRQMQTGSVEQARAMQEIGSALVRMEQLTQATAASAEETAAAGETLSGEASGLHEVIRYLNSLVSG